MSHALPPVPPANRSNKGPASEKAANAADPRLKHGAEPHISEQGDSANVRQNTTNKGGVHGNRMK